MKNVNTVSVKLWGTVVGYLHQEDNGIVGFQYDEDFLKSNIYGRISVSDIAKATKASLKKNVR